MNYLRLAIAVLCAVTAQCSYADSISVFHITQVNMFMGPNDGSGDNTRTFRWMGDLGQAYLDVGHYQDGIELLHRAIVAFNRLPSSRDDLKYRPAEQGYASSMYGDGSLSLPEHRRLCARMVRGQWVRGQRNV